MLRRESTPQHILRYMLPCLVELHTEDIAEESNSLERCKIYVVYESPHARLQLGHHDAIAYRCARYNIRSDDVTHCTRSQDGKASYTPCRSPRTRWASVGAAKHLPL